MKPNALPLEVRPRDARELFKQFHGEFYAMSKERDARGRDVWHPPTDVYETGDDIVIQVSLPGVKPDQVTVGCNGDAITICGWRGGPDARRVVRYHQMEIRNGYFERRIVLRSAFDPAAARASYKDGFLYVLIPKAERLIRHVLTIKLTT
jgi:HSP20 family protein